MIDLLQLHNAGAEVTGCNGEAWLRMSAVRNDRCEKLLENIKDRRRAIGRRVIPADLTGIAPPSCVTGETVGESSGASRGTPGSIDQQDTRVLNQAERDTLRQMVQDHGSTNAFAKSIGISDKTISRAMSGETITGSSVAKIFAERTLAEDTGDDAPAVETAPTTEPPAEMAHPLLDKILETARNRCLSMSGMCRDIGISTTCLHYLKQGKAGKTVTSKCEQWLNGCSRPVGTVDVKVDAGSPATIEYRIGKALGRALVNQARQVYVIEDGKLIERQAVLL